MLGKGYGMPSSHAQFVAFFSVSLALFLLIRHSPLPSPSYSPTTKSQRIILSTLLITYALVVAASRIYLNYHTFNQVLVGYSSGAISAVVWFGITAWARKNGYVDYILNRKEIELLRMRDLVIEEDLAEAGWAHWKKARARRYAEKFNEARKST